MYNVTVLDGRKLAKYLCLIIAVIIVFIVLNLIQNKKQQENVKQVLENATQEVYSHSYLNAIDTTIASMKYINSSNDKENKQKKSFVNSILDSELGISNRVIAKSIDNIVNTNITNVDDEREIIDSKIPDTIVTQIVEEKNITATYTNTYENVQIKNKSRV